MTYAAPRKFIGEYDVIRPIGEGTMALAYLARPREAPADDDFVVVKALRPDLMRDPHTRSIVLEESRMTSRLKHPNVVRVYETFADQDQFFLVMEHLEGKPLVDLLSKVRQSAFPLQYHLHVVMEALSGLHYAHELTDLDGNPLNVIHGYLSPPEVFVTFDGVTKVLDFGVAKAAAAVSTSSTGVSTNKIAYAAPEQMTGAALDRRVDVFAMGVVLFEAIAGERLWKGMPRLSIYSQLTTGQIPSLRSVVPSAPAELARICDRALSPKREQRYATALAMRADIEAFVKACGWNVTTAELGASLSSHFQRERSDMTRLLDASRRSDGGGISGSASNPAFAAASARSMGGVEVASDHGTRPNGAATPAMGTPAAAHAQMLRTTLGSPVDMTASRRKRMWSVVSAAALSGLVIGGVAFVRPHASAGPAATRQRTVASDEAVGGGSPAAAPSAPDTAALWIRVRPDGARVDVDGVKLPSTTPTEVTLPRDGKDHVLVVSAPGFAPMERTVPIRSDVLLEGTLERLPSSAPAATALSGSPSTTAASARSLNGSDLKGK